MQRLATALLDASTFIAYAAPTSFGATKSVNKKNAGAMQYEG